MNIKIVSLSLATMLFLGTGMLAQAQYGDGPPPPAADFSSPEPSAGTTIYNQGIQAFKYKSYDKALGYFKRALKNDKNNPDILVMVANTQVELGLYDEAIDNYRKALKIKPVFPKGRELLGEAYIRAAVQEMDTLKSYGTSGQDQLQQLNLYFTNTYENLIKCKVCP